MQATSTRIASLEGREAQNKVTLARIDEDLTRRLNDLPEAKAGWQQLGDAEAWLNRQIAEWNDAQAAQKTAATALPDLRAMREAAQTNLNVARTRQEGQKGEDEAIAKDKQTLEQERAPLLAGDTVAAVERRLQDRITAASDDRDSAKQTLSEARSAEASAKAALTSSREESARLKEIAEQQSSDFSGALGRSQLTAMQIETAAATEGDREEEEKALQALSDAVTGAQAGLQSRKVDLASTRQASALPC